MRWFSRRWKDTLCRVGLWAALAAPAGAVELAPSTEPAPEAVVEPAWQVTGLSFETGLAADQVTLLRGADSREQLVVTATLADGRMLDATARANYRVEPQGVVVVDATGLVQPLTDGLATVVASVPGAEARLAVQVAHFSDELPINFSNQISPIFTKLGCNSGGCHGKASGQNGFKLSLLGFEPAEDFEYLVREARGRRLFPAAPDRSLLLQKATNRTPHGGGQRLAADSYEYRMLRRWIAQGMPFGQADDPRVTAIEVFPSERVLARQGRQQLKVVAMYSDGGREDVTRTAQFDPNDPDMAEASVTGLISTRDLTGDVAVMARYQGQVGVFRGTLPLDVPLGTPPAFTNFVDEHVFAKLGRLGIPASAVCDDATYLRRVSLDIAGRLPTPDETRSFLADSNPARRAAWIDQLLASGEYADYFANKWSAVLRNKRRDANYVRGTYAFHDWIRQSLYDNLPYDQFVRAIVAAQGELGDNPAVVWYREVAENNQQVEDTAQLFLGLRIQCARCHHHPFEKWSQRDYYGFSAFFARVARKKGERPEEPRIFHRPGVAQAQHPKTGELIPPMGLGGAPLAIPADRDPRQALVDWMTATDNPFFSRALVNRYWKHFFDRGIVDPEDDMRLTNPAANPELLDALATHFRASHFDLKDLVRTICNSTAYQLSAQPNEFNLADKQNFSRYYPKRLSAEVLLDALNLVTASSTDFGGLPPGTRAVQLPDQGANTYFLTVFGRPQSDTACECERSQEANLAQSLHLLNSTEVQGKLTAETGRAAQLAKDTTRSEEERIGDLYLWVYSRPPVPDELQVALAHLAKQENKQLAFEDLLWALVNTKEFLFNH